MKFSFDDAPTGSKLLSCVPDEHETELVIPEGVTLIHDAALRRCTKITRLTLPSTVRYLDGSLFSTMTALEYIDVRDHPDLFSVNGVLYRRDTPATYRIVRYPAGRTDAAFVVPEDVHLIGRYAFSNAVHLKTVVLHKNVWDVHRGAFSMCLNLSYVQVGSSHLLYIREDAFRFCSRLKDVRFCGKLDHIEDRAFDGCAALERLVLPDGLVSLGNEAFVRCASLKELSLPESVESIGTDVFYDCCQDMKILCTQNVASLIPMYHDRIDLLPSF